MVGFKDFPQETGKKQKPKAKNRSFARVVKPIMASVLYTVSSGLAFWSLTEALGANRGLSQTATSESREGLPPRTPAPTFSNKDVPPQSYSPPVFDLNQSEQFNLYRLAIGDS